jgi:hypothetical protein
MTMRYTHIGLSDQARAVANLPVPALHGRCILGGAGGQSPSSAGTTVRRSKHTNPCGDRGLCSDCRSVPQTGNVEAAGIEPASNPDVTNNREICCRKATNLRAAPALHSGGNASQGVSPSDPA